MGKKKDGTKGERPEKLIPKRIGGVKLPKELRRTGDRLLAQAASPAGRAALTKGLAMMAGAAAQARAAKAPAPAANDPAQPPVGQPDPVKLAQTVGVVANEVLGRLFTGKKG